MVVCTVPCMPGTISGEEADDCVACPRGTYQEHWGTHQCHACLNGTSTAFEGTDFKAECKCELRSIIEILSVTHRNMDCCCCFVYEDNNIATVMPQATVVDRRCKDDTLGSSHEHRHWCGCCHCPGRHYCSGDQVRTASYFYFCLGRECSGIVVVTHIFKKLTVAKDQMLMPQRQLNHCRLIYDVSQYFIACKIEASL